MSASSLSLTQKRWTLRMKDPIAFLRKRHALHATQTPLDAPFAFLPQLEDAARRIRKALERKERIAIFGDYDCDGVTATAQLVRFFRRHAAEPVCRLPNRIEDGYGLSMPIVHELIDAGVNLLCTVDTGIASKKEIECLRANHIDVIVLDHHALPTELPPASIIVHPASVPAFPFPHPCGAGLAFLLITIFEQGRWNGYEEDCALACIGTIADLVELTGWNRTLVTAGLSSLNALEQGPLHALSRHVRGEGTKEPLRSSDIAFFIAPRINAAGRMADPKIALNAILHGGDALEELDRLNAMRQKQTELLFGHAMSMLPPCSLSDPPLLFAASHAFHPGIIGLIAGRLQERYGRPSCVVTIGEAACTASLRSTPHYDIVQGLRRSCEAFTKTIGGHAQAAGCTFAPEHLASFQKQLESDAEEHLPKEHRLPELLIDAPLAIEHVSLSLCKDMENLEPYGSGNPPPCFVFQNVYSEVIRCVGKDGKHIAMRCGPLKIIGFQLGFLAPMLARHRGPFDIVGELFIDTWQGASQPAIRIRDIRIGGSTLHTDTSVLSTSKTSVTETQNAAAIL